MGDTHLRQVLEKPVSTESQGMGAVVAAEGQDVSVERETV